MDIGHNWQISLPPHSQLATTATDDLSPPFSTQIVSANNTTIPCQMPPSALSDVAASAAGLSTKRAAPASASSSAAKITKYSDKCDGKLTSEQSHFVSDVIAHRHSNDTLLMQHASVITHYISALSVLIGHYPLQVPAELDTLMDLLSGDTGLPLEARNYLKGEVYKKLRHITVQTSPNLAKSVAMERIAKSSTIERCLRIGAEHGITESDVLQMVYILFIAGEPLADQIIEDKNQYRFIARKHGVAPFSKRMHRLKFIAENHHILVPMWRSSRE